VVVAAASVATIALVAPAASGNAQGPKTGNAVTGLRAPTEERAMAVAIQADGKIVAAGETFTGGGDFPLARYTTTGDLDGSFGHGGRVLNALST
jgi:hypothetical protein